MLIYTDPLFLQHDTGRHPERIQRLVSIGDLLTESAAFKRATKPQWQSASLEQLSRIHEAEYINSVKQYAERGGGQIEADTVVCPKSYQVAQHAAGAVCDAVDRVLDSEVESSSDRALCLVRPPGHHAVEDAAMGFCLFNNIAVGARHATQRHKLERVLIVDWDVHHGNGTQDAFWDDPAVGFYSIHRHPFYPGSGVATETGAGDGAGTTYNVPLEFGTSRQEYFDQFCSSVEAFAKKINPQLILISAGFDAHRLDPVGSLGLEEEDFAQLSTFMLDVAKEYCDGKIVSVLEGGYNVQVLPKCVEAHLNVLFGD